MRQVVRSKILLHHGMHLLALADPWPSEIKQALGWLWINSVRGRPPALPYPPSCKAGAQGAHSLPRLPVDLLRTLLPHQGIGQKTFSEPAQILPPFKLLVQQMVLPWEVLFPHI